MPKEWRGRFFEDFEVGDVFRSRLGRTVTEADNIWFTLLTMNTNQMHFNARLRRADRVRPAPRQRDLHAGARHWAWRSPTPARTRPRTSRWTEIKLPSPVFAGDTLWAEKRDPRDARVASPSRTSGSSTHAARAGINQRREVVIEFRRTFMVYKRATRRGRATSFPRPTTPGPSEDGSDSGGWTSRSADELRRDPRRPSASCARSSRASTGASSSPTATRTEFVAALTEHGWLAALIPEEYGGAGLGARRRRA